MKLKDPPAFIVPLQEVKIDKEFMSRDHAEFLRIKKRILNIIFR